jgi:hypothetical protein
MRPWPDDDGPWQLRLRYARDDDGQTRCVGLDLRPLRSDCPPLTGSVLRGLRLAELMQQDRAEAIAQAQARVQRYESGPLAAHVDADALAKVRRDSRNVVATQARSVRGRRPLYDDEHYKAVAAVYLAVLHAGANNPTRQVADKWTVSKAAAATWIKEARRRGLLPATTRGRTRSNLYEGDR